MKQELEEQEEDIWIKGSSCVPSFKHIEITNYFNYELRFNGVSSANNLPRIKDGVYVINLHDKKSNRTHWVSLFIDRNLAVYFDSFIIEYISQEVLNKIRDKSITQIYLEYKIMNLLCVDFIVSLS